MDAYPARHVRVVGASARAGGDVELPRADALGARPRRRRHGAPGPRAPFTGFASVVHEWDWTGEWDKHWMQLAPNGDVVLFATSTEHTDHAAARFSVPPMVARAKVTVTSLFVANNELLYRPTIDPRGYSRIVLSSGRTSVLRSESIGGSAADLVDLQAML